MDASFILSEDERAVAHWVFINQKPAGCGTDTLMGADAFYMPIASHGWSGSIEDNKAKWTAIPVIVVSARGHEREKVEALNLGADDYITKPFGTSELLARIRTALRHSQRSLSGSPQEADKITVGDLEIDYSKRRVSIAGKEVHLTPIEYKIIVLLSKYIGKVLTHDFIIKEVWGPYANEIQSLRVNMANIRRKLESNPAEPKYIVTEVGVGYRMVEELHDNNRA